MSIEKNLHVGEYLSKIDRLMNMKFNENMDEVGLTASQTNVLHYLLENIEADEINQKDIEAALQLSGPTVTGIIKRLEKKDFLVKATSRKDARYNRIVLTEKSRKVKERILASVDVVDARLTRGMSEDEVRLLKDLLSRVLENAMA